ncbi:MAG: hypothetical protein ACRDRA_04155 [Pseudonocardiaceae bacterium]
MRKTGPNQVMSALDLHGMMAQRFPLVPHTKPACRALEVRVARVRHLAHLAHLASQRTDESLVRAGEAHNLTALIISDCGMPGLALTLCWQQFEIFRTARCLDTAKAKLALQPLINLGRLLIRDGAGTTAYQLLAALFEAVKSHADTVIDGRKISFGHLLGHGDDHREVIRWLWSVLLSDGTRALTRTGRWAQALQHAQQHKGIGQRLLDGRQAAILAQAVDHDFDAARSMLASTLTPTPWENAVAACLAVLCRRLADQQADPDITEMVDRYLQLELAPEHTFFRVRLGLCVLDLADADETPEIAAVIVRDALDSTDAYAAHAALSHQTCHAQITPENSRALTDIVQVSGLGRGTVPADMLDDLMESVRTSEASIADALAAQTP